MLVSERALADFFEAVAKGRDAKAAANWVINELTGRLNKEKILALFTEDCVWDGGVYGKREGKAALRAYYDQNNASEAPLAYHLLTNPIIEVNGDQATGNWHLTIMLLPALCLGTASAANIARTTRASMLDVLRSDYIRTATAKGLADRLVVLKHAFKNELIPVVTVAGLQMGILLGGAVVIEEVFTLPGVGRLVLWSIYQRDYPLTQSTILFIAFLFMAINLAVDLLYGYLDPRIRYSS